MSKILNISDFKEFLHKGSTKPFIAFSDTNQKFVVKALIDFTSRKKVMSEYLTGVLADKIGLCRPKAYLACLTDTTKRDLSKASINVLAPDCVALEFVEGLTDVPSLFYSPNFKKEATIPEQNHAHISKFFFQPENQSMFYGNALFEIWLLFTDINSDTLFKKADGTPFFLDGSHGFGDEDGFENLKHSFSNHQSLPISTNLEGILRNKNLFKKWFAKIDSIQQSFIISMLDEIPERLLSLSEKEILFKFFTVERKNFIEIWTYRIQNDSL
jgi:hypothetical protein